MHSQTYRSALFPIITALVILAQAATASAISIRDDVAEQEYFDLAAPYDAVARVSGGGFIASGVLVTPTKFLTAAHFTDANEDGVIDAGTNYTIRFGTDVSSPTNTISSSNVSSVSIHPDWAPTNGDRTFDLSVITLNTAFTSIAPMQLSDQDPTGLIGTMIGYGLHGTGASFNDQLDGRRRAAENIIDSFGDTVRTDFDSPDENTNTFGSAVPLALEGTTARGDSGGPLLADFGNGQRVVGILSGGFNGFGDLSEYGDVSIWAPLTDESSVTYLQSEGIGFAVIPEPSVALLLTSSLTLIALRRPRRVA